jgi:ATP-dependent Lon protease
MTEPLRPQPDQMIEVPDVLTVLPLKDAVIFPYLILPLSIADEETMQTVDRALTDGRVLLLTAQRSPDVDRPGPDDLYQVGTAATIMRLLKLPDGRVRILVQGLCRARLEHVSRSEPFLMARISKLDDLTLEEMDVTPLELEARVRSVREGLERAAALGRGISPEVLGVSADVTDPGRLADLVAGNLDLPVVDAQKILEIQDPLERLTQVGELLTREIQVLTMQAEISSQARGEMDRSQREYYLRQQLKAIQDELGEGDELGQEIAEYRRLAGEKELPEEALEEMERQIRRLERSHPDSAETTLQRTYLDWLTALPWNTVSEDQLELDHARDALDSDHYGLEKVKERILEHLAVQILSTRRTGKPARGPLLCFVGPPGVGKTSLGRAIARALGRQFVRLSLGGVRDEAEIRGHRRTYVGALPGRILQGLRRAGTSNPVFMLDEIDKIGADHRGDPSSALLEVLDPEQNDTFSDHYLGLPYDLSQVLFITTANLLDPIQPAFLDRMEVIRLTGYTPEEKLTIARKHLLPRQMEASGLTGDDLVVPDETVSAVIADYTREAGLRNLERELAAICRKVAVTVADRPEPAEGEPQAESITIDPERVVELLGPPRHYNEELMDRDRVGVATGLAWTAAGGDLMFIEALRVPGQGKLHLTGQLGEVMKESGQTALTYARGWAEAAGLPREELLSHDVHVHAPAGSIPKDGPSAGITIAVALISALTGRTVRRRVAMTGEITLRGDVMPIGGLKEKVMAARLAGVETVLIPRLNGRDLGEIPDNIRGDLTFHLVDHMGEVLERALGEGDTAA